MGYLQRLPRAGEDTYGYRSRKNWSPSERRKQGAPQAAYPTGAEECTTEIRGTQFSLTWRAAALLYAPMDPHIHRHCGCLEEDDKNWQKEQCVRLNERE